MRAWHYREGTLYIPRNRHMQTGVVPDEQPLSVYILHERVEGSVEGLCNWRCLVSLAGPA
jgi:hypothetical protein